MRGGTCLWYFLGPTVHGKNTPVPPRANLLAGGPSAAGLAGAKSTIGACSGATPPHRGPALTIRPPPPAAAAAAAVAVSLCSGCHRVIAFPSGAVEGLTAATAAAVSEGRTLTKVTLILVCDEGQITCLARSALFPRITSSDLPP